jgi:D-3-phosphoglycerate dehydrogenase
MLILISDAFGPELPDTLTRFGEVTSDKDRLGEAEIVLVRSKTKCTREYINSAPQLKLIIRGGVGMDNIDIPYAESRGIRCVNTPDASTTAVAELAFALMIALPNHITAGDASMRQGQWLKKELKRTELQGKTLGILGLGRIGLALAVRARAFQMKVLGWHPDAYFTDFAEICPTMEEVLEGSDFVSLHMPQVPATQGLINKQTLGSSSTRRAGRSSWSRTSSRRSRAASSVATPRTSGTRIRPKARRSWRRRTRSLCPTSVPPRRRTWGGSLSSPSV